MSEIGRGRESDIKVYPTELPKGTAVYDRDPGPNGDRPTTVIALSAEMTFLVKGADRRHKTHVPGTLVPVKDIQPDGRVRDGWTYYVSQEVLNQLREQRSSPGAGAVRVEVVERHVRASDHTQIVMVPLIFSTDIADGSYLRPDGKRKRR